MTKQVIGCGCSFTTGYTYEGMVKPYVSFLAESLSTDCTNLAVTGVSNYHIAKQIEHALSLDPLIVIVGATTTRRIDYNLNNNINSRISYEHLVKSHEHIEVNKVESKSLLSIEGIVNRKGIGKNHIEKMIYIKEYLYAMNPMLKIDQDRLFLLGALSLLDKKNVPYVVVDFGDVFIENNLEINNFLQYNYANLQKMFPCEIDINHWSVDGHIFLANKIVELIEQNKIL